VRKNIKNKCEIEKMFARPKQRKRDGSAKEVDHRLETGMEREKLEEATFPQR